MHNDEIKEVEDIGLVKEVFKDGVRIEMIPQGSCDSCGLHGICIGDKKRIIHTIKTDLDLAVGDRVRVEIAPGLRLFSSFMIFIFPIITMIIFYIFGKMVFKLSEDLSIVVSIFGLIISGVIIKLVDKKQGSKINFEITKKV